jgi:hypothetical protein
MLAEMTAAELGEWEAYARIAGPFGEMRADIRAAQLVATLINVNRVKGKILTITDCLLRWEPAQPRTAEQWVAIGREVCASLGGKFVEASGNGQYR